MNFEYEMYDLDCDPLEMNNLLTTLNGPPTDAALAQWKALHPQLYELNAMPDGVDWPSVPWGS